VTEKLYLADSYLKDFTAKVVEAEGIILDRTAFYPASGGQPADLGKLFHGDEGLDVVHVEKSGDKIAHILKESSLEMGNEVIGKIDWDRRYKFMRFHTSMHLISTIVLQKYNSFITGNQIGLEKSRIDFNLRDYDKEELLSYVDEHANNLIKKGAEVKSYFLDREEALNIPFAKRLKTDSLPPGEKLRIVEIEGFDREICGGTHVRNLSEVKEIETLGLRSKGKDNKRLEFTLKGKDR